METLVLRLRLIALALRRLFISIGVGCTERPTGGFNELDALEMWTEVPLVWIVPCPGAVYRGADLGPAWKWPMGVRRYLYETTQGCKTATIWWPDADLVIPRERADRP